MKKPESLLTSRDVASYFQRSPRTIRRWRAAGLLPWVSLPNGGVAFEREEILTLVSRWSVSPRSAQPTPSENQQ